MTIVNAELSVMQAVAQFITYAVTALFLENIVFSRALGVSRLLKLVEDPHVKTLQYCLPVILVQLLSAPLGWAAHSYFFPWLRTLLPSWLPYAALRPLIYLSCSAAAMMVTWVLLALVRKPERAAYREQLPLATCNCCVLGTLLICANQNFSLLQSTGFGFGSGLGYLFAVFVVDEGRRRLRSKDVPAIFRGLPSSLIYIGVISLAIYGFVGHGVAL